jgi:hypothetical protein
MGDGPIRVKLSRAKGWRMPANTVKVDRSTKWGNPFRVGDQVQSDPSQPVAVCFSQAEAVQAFSDFCNHAIGAGFVEAIKKELRGKNLACWCALDQPCHADVLLKMANAKEPRND